MGLSEKARLALEGKGFNALYDNHEDDWINLANDARDLIKPRIANGNPTVDDIKLILQPLVELHQHYRTFMEQHPKLTQQYWSDYFTDYVLHKVYRPTLHVEDEHPLGGAPA
jgi:hypothetical protein